MTTYKSDAMTRLLFRISSFGTLYRVHVEFSTSFVGVAFGVICGIQARRVLYPSRVEDGFGFLIALEGINVWVLMRAMVGLVALGLAKAVTKQVFSRILPLVYAYFPVRIRSAWQPPIVDGNEGAGTSKRGIKQTLDGRDADIDATTRFASYAALGFTASIGVLAW